MYLLSLATPLRDPPLLLIIKALAGRNLKETLHGLAYASCKDEEDFFNTNQPSSRKVSGINKGLMLESIPSFSYSNFRGRREDDESDWEDNEDKEEYLDENDEEMSQRNMISGIEVYYKKMVEENPGNPLFLSNYAQFLYQSKQDLPKAEEYDSRTILADPGDGEILSQYAKLVWELHQDEDRTYYEIAVHASPENRYINIYVIQVG